MGLDQYLYRQYYFLGDKLPVLKLGNQKTIQEIKSANVQIMYWRKCNAIHNWFVQNVQDGVDDCKSYTFDYETLEQLHKAVVKELDSRNGGESTGELEPVEGFFFGSTEKDEWYWKDLERTKIELGEILKEDDAIDYAKIDHLIDYSYRSSW